MSVSTNVVSQSQSGPSSLHPQTLSFSHTQSQSVTEALEQDTCGYLMTTFRPNSCQAILLKGKDVKIILRRKVLPAKDLIQKQGQHALFLPMQSSPLSGDMNNRNPVMPVSQGAIRHHGMLTSACWCPLRSSCLHFSDGKDNAWGFCFFLPLHSNRMMQSLLLQSETLQGLLSKNWACEHEYWSSDYFMRGEKMLQVFRIKPSVKNENKIITFEI